MAYLNMWSKKQKSANRSAKKVEDNLAKYKKTDGKEVTITKLKTSKETAIVKPSYRGWRRENKKELDWF